jgi:hypothetical protein
VNHEAGLLLGGGLVVAAALAYAIKRKGGLYDVTLATFDPLGRASEHFTWRELTTTSQPLDNTPATATHLANLATLATRLETVRGIMGRPLRVTSAYRSPAVNTAVGGSPTSDHPSGLAADLYTMDGSLSNEDMAEKLYRKRSALPWIDQVIVERHTGHLHLGIGPRKRQQFLQFDGATYSPWSPA